MLAMKDLKLMVNLVSKFILVKSTMVDANISATRKDQPFSVRVKMDSNSMLIRRHAPKVPVAIHFLMEIHPKAIFQCTEIPDI